MNQMFKIEMLPAEHGDCLWIEYGDKNTPRKILIDGGTIATYSLLSERILKLPVNERCFELLIITHVDADHIEGIVKLLQNTSLQVVFKDVWFNGWKHLSDLLSPVDGEYLSGLLENGNYNWNMAFNEEAVVTSDSKPLPNITLTDGLQIVLLSPDEKLLERLKDDWKQVVEDANLLPGDADMALKKLKLQKRFNGDTLLGEQKIDVEALATKRFSADRARANGSSIAVLLKYAGKTCLLAGDAFSSTIANSLKRLPEYQTSDKKIKLDAFKLPHHGSEANISAELLQLIDCSKYLFSTNGKHFKHPSRTAVARVIKYGGRDITLCFNYQTDYTECWKDKDLIKEYNYRTLFPKAGCQGLSIIL
jgi:beta-lactamase superfamily II metal-dependent hydrolase